MGFPKTYTFGRGRLPAHTAKNAPGIGCAYAQPEEGAINHKPENKTLRPARSLKKP
jgi:hypothetical protein